MARTIRMAQSLGFSLREIAALNVEYQAKRLTSARAAEILHWQLTRLEEKAAHVNAMIRYVRAKLAWLDAGGKGPEPIFTDYEKRARAVGRKTRAPVRKPRGRAPTIARRASRNGGRVQGADQ